MEKVLSLTIPIMPKAVQSTRFRAVGKFGYSYTPKAVKDWKKQIRDSVISQLPEGWEVLDCALATKYSHVFPPLKSFNKKTMKEIADGKIIYKITKPDYDNLGKGLSDSLTGLIWKDDALVVRNLSEKFYGMEAKIIVEVFKI